MFKLINALAELVEASELWYDEISNAEYADEPITAEQVSKWKIGMQDDLEWYFFKVTECLKALDKQTQAVYTGKSDTKEEVA
jgi:hypothetical protein